MNSRGGKARGNEATVKEHYDTLYREYKEAHGGDPVNHPTHYTSHPSGIECIEITRYMGFNLGNAIKYIWRADLKNDALEDLKKAEFYIKDEIRKREKNG